jgi:DNA-directed RNA polymerase specialized sigma24 family protein
MIASHEDAAPAADPVPPIELAPAEWQDVQDSIATRLHKELHWTLPKDECAGWAGLGATQAHRRFRRDPAHNLAQSRRAYRTWLSWKGCYLAKDAMRQAQDIQRRGQGLHTIPFSVLEHRCEANGSCTVPRDTLMASRCIADAAASHVDTIDHRDLAGACLARLSETEAFVVESFFYRGQGYAAIADSLDCSVSNVMAIRRKAMGKMQRFAARSGLDTSCLTAG